MIETHNIHFWEKIVLKCGITNLGEIINELA